MVAPVPSSHQALIHRDSNWILLEIEQYCRNDISMDRVITSIAHLVYEHLVQAHWSEGGFDDVSDGRRCGDVLRSDVL